MAIPHSRDARLFYRCAFQRYEEAQILVKAGKTTGAVYLAGYGVECLLKALILEAVPASGRPDILKSFRGTKAHQYEWLHGIYSTNGGARWPAEMARHLTLVNDWSTELRNIPASVRPEDAEAFMHAAAAIMAWADGRL